MPMHKRNGENRKLNIFLYKLKLFERFSLNLNDYRDNYYYYFFLYRTNYKRSTYRDHEIKCLALSNPP